MAKVCDMDCFNCKFDDCIKDDVYSEKSRHCFRSEQYKQYSRDYQKKRRDAAREKGYCLICQKVPATHGTYCTDCYYRQKRYYQNRKSGKREHWKEEGLCYFCGKKTLEGKKVCAEHYGYLKSKIDYVNSLPQTKEAQIRFGAWYWNNRKGERNERDM